MANVTMYSMQHKKQMTFHVTCTPSKEDCDKCPLKSNCDKKVVA